MKLSWLVRVVAVTILLPVLGGCAIQAKVATEVEQEFLANFHYFNPVDAVEFYNLVNDHTEAPVALDIQWVDAGAEISLSFQLPAPTAVYLSVSASEAEAAMVQPLVVERHGHNPRLLPLIRSSTPERAIWSSIRLGHFGAGDHTLSLKQDKSVVLPIPRSIQLVATRPSHDSMLAELIDHHPMVEIQNPQNVLDDIPLVSFSRIYQRGTSYNVKSQLIFSSENGGRKPPDLMDAFQRTLDVEWVMEQVVVRSGQRYSVTHQKYQGINHTHKRYEDGDRIGRSPVLYIVTPNNTFGSQKRWQSRWQEWVQRLKGDESRAIIFAPKPVFLPPGQGSADIIGRIPELQEWSQYEIALEGCVDVSDRNNPAIQQFLARLDWVRQQLADGLEFPDRGCREQLLSLPSTDAESEVAYIVRPSLLSGAFL